MSEEEKTTKKYNYTMKTGAPTKYKEEYNTKDYLDGYFSYAKENEELVSNCGLAVYIGICEDTLYEWAKVHPDFSVSLKKVKQVSKNMLYNKGLNKEYDSGLTKLLLSHNHGHKERTDITSNDESITVKMPDKMKDV